MTTTILKECVGQVPASATNQEIDNERVPNESRPPGMFRGYGKDRIFIKYPSLNNDDDFSLLVKEVSSESYRIYSEGMQVSICELMKEEIEQFNLQRTYYFLQSSTHDNMIINVSMSADTFAEHIAKCVNRPLACMKQNSNISHSSNVTTESDDVKDYSNQSVGMMDYDGEIYNTPLIEAILQKKWYITKVLLFYGADITRLSCSGKAPLHEAILHSDVPSDILRYLITEDNIHIPDQQGNTALHLAITVDAEFPRFDLVEILCEKGADKNRCNHNKHLPIHLALLDAYYAAPNQDALKQLVTEDNINAADDHGDTPLHLACHGCEEMVSYLVKMGASLNVRNNGGETPLSIATRSDLLDTKVIAKLITDENINISMGGMFPLCCAVWMGHLDLVHDMVILGADVNCKNILPDEWDSDYDDDVTPLHQAVKWYHDDNFLSISKVLTSDKNINMRTGHQRTPLILALEKKNYKAVPCLISCGADINMRMKRTTPLLTALKRKDPNVPDLEILRLLVSEEMVNVSIKNVTAFRRAFETGRWELIPVLLQYGADGPDVRGVSAAGKHKGLDPHVRGRFDEQPDSLLDITVSDIRNLYLARFDDEYIETFFSNYKTFFDGYEVVLKKGVKRLHTLDAVLFFKNDKISVEERKSLMDNVLTDYVNGERQ